MNNSDLLEQLRLAAEQGDAVAQYGMGVVYDMGELVTLDSVEAAKWYRRAAEQEHAEAQYSLGVRYAAGQGLTQDTTEASKWISRAADNGCEDAIKFSRGEF